MIEVKQNFIDKAIGYLDPVRAARRMRSRAMMAIAGAYIGASRTRRATQEWITATGDADSDVIYDLKVLRERSRDLARNAPIATGAISTCLTNTIGTGLTLDSRIDRQYLGLSDEDADEWEANTEREFRMWAQSRECDVSRKFNFATLQELAFRQVLENGEVFTLLPKVTRPGSPYMLKVQLVEADRVCNEGFKSNTDKLIEGIERDDYGAPVYYHILNQHPGAPYYSRKSYTWTIMPAFSPTGMPNVMHLFRPIRPGQTRGVPYLAPVIETLKQLDRYTEAEIMAAVISSMFTVFIKSESGDMEFDTEELGQETGAKVGDKDMKLASGAIIGLAKGESIESADPTRPNSAFDPFMKSILEQIGAALEIPFEIIIRHFSASYSASRAALLEAWRFFRGRRAWMAAYFCQAIYEAFLYEAVVVGRIRAPGFFSDPMIRYAYCQSVWGGDSPGYIDRQKDVDASVTLIENGMSTLDEETRLLTGGDMEKNLPRIRKERAALKEIGLWSSGQKKPAKAPDQSEQIQQQIQEGQQ
jgi:lambda family phage portal protein